MIPADISKRLTRLLGGDHRTDDLIHVLTWLRFQTGGCAPFVKDVGDFIAHRHERDQGHTWRTALDFYNLTRYGIALVMNPSSITRDMYVQGCRSCLRLVKPSDVRATTGLSYKTAGRRLESGLAKLAALTGQKADYSQAPTDEEAAIIEFCSTRLIGLEGVSQKDLLKQFRAAIERNGQYPTVSFELNKKFEDFLSKFVVTLLHGAWILSENKVKVGFLQIGQENDSVRIAITLPFETPVISSTVYKTELPFPDSLSPTLLNSTDEIENLCLEINRDSLIDII